MLTILIKNDMATDERQNSYSTCAGPFLEALLFHYWRYLLISSSRPGTQPTNLQGIWNQDMRPPWSSNYTLNINIEINYWLAEVTNLPECTEPLFDLIGDLGHNGSKTARVNYGVSGWVIHHNADLWRQTAPVGDFEGDQMIVCRPGPTCSQRIANPSLSFRHLEEGVGEYRLLGRVRQALLQPTLHPDRQGSRYSGQAAGQVDGGGCFAYPSLLIGNDDDFG